MKKSIALAAFCLAGISQAAFAYEYPLQFKPNAGYRGLIVAGYQIEGNTVIGNCSYYTVSAVSGKGGGGRAPAKTYAQTCTWDLHGNLLHMAAGAPKAPAPLYTKGSQIVYALDANGNYAGTDSKLPERGFVNSPGSHYTCLTPSNAAVLQQIVYTLTATLKSDGDMPVNISDVQVSALNGVVTLKETKCKGEINVGDKCSITVSYDPTNVTGANGVGSDTLRIDLTSNAGAAHDFVQNFTVILPQN
jgi:hypothetical protein